MIVFRGEMESVCGKGKGREDDSREEWRRRLDERRHRNRDPRERAHYRVRPETDYACFLPRRRLTKAIEGRLARELTACR